MSDVQATVEKVVEEVKEFFVLEKAHLQSFLNYLANRPYQEVFQHIENMKTARQFIPAGQEAPPAVATPVVPEVVDADGNVVATSVAPVAVDTQPAS